MEPTSDLAYLMTKRPFDLCGNEHLRQCSYSIGGREQIAVVVECPECQSGDSSVAAHSGTYVHAVLPAVRRACPYSGGFSLRVEHSDIQRESFESQLNVDSSFSQNGFT